MPEKPRHSQTIPCPLRFDLANHFDIAAAFDLPLLDHDMVEWAANDPFGNDFIHQSAARQATVLVGRVGTAGEHHQNAEHNQENSARHVVPS